MAVDRDQWASKFSSLPAWSCPTCGKGHFQIIPGKIYFEETGPSLAAHDHEAWDPDWIENRFAGFMKCTLSACGEVASVSGTSPSDYYEDYENGSGTLFNHFIVRAIDPAPLPIGMPSDTPKSVVLAIGEAARVIWMSADCAANQIRQTVEHLMDELAVAKNSANGQSLTLHARIKEFGKNDLQNGEILLAIKWLGNSASHIGSLNLEDVLDAFDMLELVLENLYGTVKKSIMAKVAAVNAQKGPSPKAKKP